MWRDQVNYFTRQIIKSQCFLSFFGQGQKRGTMGRICTGSRSDILKKIFFKLILCQNVFCKCSTHAMYVRQKKLIRTYFHMWFCILPLGGQTWFLFLSFFFWYCSSVQLCYYSAFTLWNCILILKEPLYCKGCISVCSPDFLNPDVVLYCPLLSENHSCILRTTSWCHLSRDFITDVLEHALFWNFKG